MVGYFQMLNEKGGINGRKVNLISLDNAFSPPIAIEQTRKLVEDDGVLAEVGTVGTVPNVAVQKYLNTTRLIDRCAWRYSKKPLGSCWTSNHAHAGDAA
jgi:ABC-type branched-subunit amino acid transport system substrate-binding protein